MSSWENVTPDGLERIKAPGGWLYCYRMGTALTFVPEPRRELGAVAFAALERALEHLPELALRLLKRFP